MSLKNRMRNSIHLTFFNLIFFFDKLEVTIFAGTQKGKIEMYEYFYGLKEKPFNLTPDPDYLYMSPGHENVYNHLEYAIQESKGFVVVSGEVGAGKTTLINYLLRKIPQTSHVGIIN